MKNKKMKRVESGIPGLDIMLNGGFPSPSAILIGGDPGTGKTTLALQSLFYSAKKGERGVYINAISEPAWVIEEYLSEFKFYSQKLVDTKKVIFLDINEKVGRDPNYILDEIKKYVEIYNPSKIAIDSITSIQYALEDNLKYRRFLYDIITYLKIQGCVTFLISELTYEGISKSIDAYVADGIIVLSYLELENSRMKCIEILKMRGTNHMTGKRSLIISEEGVRVQPEIK
ncbi:MAG TPA: hypothetical protein ENG50_01260 [Candidatus Altiarchaeales archaeon]|nr:hypothetical protein [Candidatus Altiarchaeales archaeon]